MIAPQSVIVQILQKVPIFSVLEEPELHQLASLGATRRIRKEEVIFLQGEPGRHFFIILQGKVKVFFEDGAGRRAETVLGPWDCVSCPANVVHGYENVGLEPAYLQVMLGAAKPQLMGYVDEDLARRRDEHLRTPAPSR